MSAELIAVVVSAIVGGWGMAFGLHVLQDGLRALRGVVEDLANVK